MARKKGIAGILSRFYKKHWDFDVSAKPTQADMDRMMRAYPIWPAEVDTPKEWFPGKGGVASIFQGRVAGLDPQAAMTSFRGRVSRFPARKGPFYSPLERALSGEGNKAAKQLVGKEMMPAHQVSNILSKSGVTPTELKWTGVGSVLEKAGQSPVSLAEIRRIAGEGRIEVETPSFYNQKDSWREHIEKKGGGHIYKAPDPLHHLDPEYRAPFTPGEDYREEAVQLKMKRSLPQLPEGYTITKDGGEGDIRAPFVIRDENDAIHQIITGYNEQDAINRTFDAPEEQAIFPGTIHMGGLENLAGWTRSDLQRIVTPEALEVKKEYGKAEKLYRTMVEQEKVHEPGSEAWKRAREESRKVYHKWGELGDKLMRIQPEAEPGRTLHEVQSDWEKALRQDPEGAPDTPFRGDKAKEVAVRNWMFKALERGERRLAWVGGEAQLERWPGTIEATGFRINKRVFRESGKVELYPHSTSGERVSPYRFENVQAAKQKMGKFIPEEQWEELLRLPSEKEVFDDALRRYYKTDQPPGERPTRTWNQIPQAAKESWLKTSFRELSPTNITLRNPEGDVRSITLGSEAFPSIYGGSDIGLQEAWQGRPDIWGKATRPGTAKPPGKVPSYIQKVLKGAGSTGEIQRGKTPEGNTLFYIDVEEPAAEKLLQGMPISKLDIKGQMQDFYKEMYYG